MGFIAYHLQSTPILGPPFSSKHTAEPFSSKFTAEPFSSNIRLNPAPLASEERKKEKKRKEKRVSILVSEENGNSWTIMITNRILYWGFEYSYSHDVYKTDRVRMPYKTVPDLSICMGCKDGPFHKHYENTSILIVVGKSRDVHHGSAKLSTD